MFNIYLIYLNIGIIRKNIQYIRIQWTIWGKNSGFTVTFYFEVFSKSFLDL